MPLSLVARQRAKRWLQALLLRALPFWVCGSAAWFAVLALDIASEQPEPARYLARAHYMVELACRYASLFLAPLIALHSLRALWLRHSPRADSWLSLVIASGLAPLCYRTANQLSSGGALWESQARLPVLALLFVVLLLGHLTVWHVHLALVGARHHLLAEAFARRSRSLRVAVGFVLAGLGGTALVVFSEMVSRELRAYLFLSERLLPSAFIFAASLVYGLQLRAARWLSIVLALGLCIGLYVNTSQRAAAHRAQAFFERRAGLVALTELASSRARGAPYANLDISHPERFHCLPETPRSAPTPPPANHRNVILISVDTLRKDALFHQDQQGPVAPSLREIARQSLFFEHAVTTYPATLFAVTSALTGQSPSEVMFAAKRPDNLFTRTRSLFQEVEIALPDASWFKRPPVPQLFTQGITPHHFPDAQSATSHVLRKLRDARARKRSTLTWVHYYEPHTTPITRGRGAERLARERYAQLVRSVDAQIGRLWRELERLGYLRDSLVILFSDHGEALGEFGYFGHHVYLNQFATDVPLIVHTPDGPARRSPALALLSDIAPTVLDWLGQPNDSAEAQSLLTLPEAAPERFGVSEAFPVRGRTLYDVAGAPLENTEALRERLLRLRSAAIDYQPKVALVSARHRLIVNRVTGAEEFYDRAEDPQERNDRAAENLPEYQRMRAALERIMRERSERIFCRVQASQAHAK